MDKTVYAVQTRLQLTTGEAALCLVSVHESVASCLMIVADAPLPSNG